jgi:hypothetical protein
MARAPGVGRADAVAAVLQDHGLAWAIVVAFIALADPQHRDRLAVKVVLTYPSPGSASTKLSDTCSIRRNAALSRHPMQLSCQAALGSFSAVVGKAVFSW